MIVFAYSLLLFSVLRGDMTQINKAVTYNYNSCIEKGMALVGKFVKYGQIDSHGFQ